MWTESNTSSSSSSSSWSWCHITSDVNNRGRPKCCSDLYVLKELLVFVSSYIHCPHILFFVSLLLDCLLLAGWGWTKYPGRPLSFLSLIVPLPFPLRTSTWHFHAHARILLHTMLHTEHKIQSVTHNCQNFVLSLHSSEVQLVFLELLPLTHVLHTLKLWVNLV